MIETIVVYAYLLIGAAHVIVYAAGIIAPRTACYEFGLDMAEFLELRKTILHPGGVFNGAMVVLLLVVISAAMLTLWPVWRMISSRIRK